MFAARKYGVKRIFDAAVARTIFFAATRAYPFVFRRSVVLTMRTMDHNFASEPGVVDQRNGDQHDAHPRPEAEALPGETVHRREAITEILGMRAGERFPRNEAYQGNHEQADSEAFHEYHVPAQTLGWRVFHFMVLPFLVVHGLENDAGDTENSPYLRGNAAAFTAGCATRYDTLQ